MTTEVTIQSVDGLSQRIFDVIYEVDPDFNVLMNSLTHVLAGVAVTYCHDDETLLEGLLTQVHAQAQLIASVKLERINAEAVYG